MRKAKAPAAEDDTLAQCDRVIAYAQRIMRVADLARAAEDMPEGSRAQVRALEVTQRLLANLERTLL